MYGASMRRMTSQEEFLRFPETGFVRQHADKKFQQNRNAERILAFLEWRYKLKSFATKLNGGEKAVLWGAKRFLHDGKGYLPNGQLFLAEIYGTRNTADCMSSPIPDHHSL